jgi:hypothetical protein
MVRLYRLRFHRIYSQPSCLRGGYRINCGAPGESVRADARGRTVGSLMIPTPWEVQWSNYERRDGMCIPTGGEVAWVLPEGPKPYFRGRITSLRYEFAQ